MKKIFLSIMAMVAFTCAAFAGENDLLWDYTEANIPTSGPDNGLYYSSYVNDATGTNMGLHGVKLNSSGWAYFEKATVAGTLKLTIGNRKNADAYAVNVYKATKADGANPVKGDLIGEVAVTEGPGIGSIDLDATTTGIYIERKTGSEGVLCKVEFKEAVARTFVDFEMVLCNLAAEYDFTQLPAGVSCTGTYNGDQHGYRDATVVIPVDGTVKFTIGDCKYGNRAFNVKNQNGDVVTTLNYAAQDCYGPSATDKVFTYIYAGEPTTLTFENIQYLNYFKAEATEVQEATITYKDQNGNKLAEKTVFEGDAIGAVPDSLNAKIIPGEGNAFRGWVYSTKVKINAADIVTGNTTISALVTPIETVTLGSVQTYDLSKKTFYAEDHETCSAENGHYYNEHGWDFAANGSFSVQVAGKAEVVLTLCQYGNGTTFSVTDANNNTIVSDLPAKVETDGGAQSFRYNGPATTLTITFAAQTYLHKVAVYNVTDFLEMDESGYYIVPAGDAAALIMAINTANSTPNTKIFLPNGVYDLGQAVKTPLSGTNTSIIGQSREGTIIMNAPAIELEGLDKADLFSNTGTGLYLQDLTLKNALDYHTAGTGRAAVLHDKGNQTICKNVRFDSYQDTYYSHKKGSTYYFEDGVLMGTVDYLCGDGKVYFNHVTLYNRSRVSGGCTMTANSELYVFQYCSVECEDSNTEYNFGRAWSDNPKCVFLNTTLQDNGAKLLSTRWNLSGINCDYSVAGEFGTMNADGTDITPASNSVTFKKANTTLNTILTAEEAATYTYQSVFGTWDPAAETIQKELTYTIEADGSLSWETTQATVFLKETEEGVEIITSLPTELEEGATYRAANARGGFGPAAYNKQTVALENVEACQVRKYMLNGQLVIEKNGIIYNALGARL